MPTQFVAGKPYPRTLDPVQSKIANGRGLYPWSAFYAPLVYLEPGKGNPPVSSIQAASGLNNAEVSLLLFTADIPIIAQAYVRGVESGRYNVMAVQNRLTLPLALLGDAPSGLVGPVTASNYGEVLKGYTAEVGPAPGVAVSGFGAAIFGAVETPFIAVSGDNLVPDGVDSVAISCIANGAVASGVVGAAFCSSDNTAISDAPTPIILRSSDYTQAIKDNNNLLVAENGDLGQVVGLYYAVVP